MIQVKLANQMIAATMQGVTPGQNICFFIEAIALSPIVKTAEKMIMNQKELFNYYLSGQIVHIESQFSSYYPSVAVIKINEHYFFLSYDPKKVDVRENDYLSFDSSLIINDRELGGVIYFDDDVDYTLGDSLAAKRARLARHCKMYKVSAVHQYLYLEKQKKYLIEEVEESGLTGLDDLSDFILTVENTHLSAYEVLKEQHKLYGGIDIAKFNF